MGLRSRAFTLVELLVVIAVIALLIGILVPSLAGARKAAEAAVAMAACRSLGQAYTMYADDQRGFVLPAHLDPSQPGGVKDEFGNAIGPPVSQRWTYRLGPWFDYGWAGTTHVGRRKELLGDFEEIVNGPNGMFMWSYQVSVFPSFGINHRYVGGDFRDPAQIAQNYHVRRIDQPFAPTRLIVFASSRFRVPPTTVDGYIEVDPPPLGSTFIESDPTDAPAKAFGFNHPRYGGRSMAVFMDGHAAGLTPGELLDRTRWSDPAARAGKGDWEP